MIVFRVLVILLLIWSVAGCIPEDDGQPIANAGPDKVVDASKSGVELRGEASFDPNGDALVYHWSIEAMPAGSNAVLSSFTGQSVRLTVDVFGLYEIGLIVDDGITASNKDIVRIEYRTEKVSAENSSTTSDENQHPAIPFHVGIEGKPCSECHSKSPIHFPSSDACDSCHASTLWIPAIKVDHTQVNGACADCHNGLIAMGKTQHHITSTDLCEVCHTSNLWIPVATVDHTQVIGTCFNCHNGTVALGKMTTHFNTSDNCQACHTAISWRPVLGVDHTQVFGMCVDCHNNTIAMGKPASHIFSSDFCGECHNTRAWLPTPPAAPPAPGPAPTPTPPLVGAGIPPGLANPETPFDHTGITDNCVSCHSGIRDLSIGPFHRLPTSAVCEACHATEAWAPSILVNHDVMVGPCIQCHNNMVSTGKPVSHLASTDVCGACHTTTSFVPVAVDHIQVLGSCELCHAYPAAHATLGVTKGCDNCHSTVTWVNPVNPLPTPIVNNGG